MLLKALVLPFLAVSVLALPQRVQPIGSIEKRASPGISGSDYSATNQGKISAGFHEALILASYARSFIDSQDEGAEIVYEKYFPQEDKATVRQVYQNILGDDNTGGNRLSSITVVNDFPLPGTNHYACTNPHTGAVLRYYTYNRPKMIICPAGLQLPALGSVQCATLQGQMSNQMDTLGASILHEYTHFRRLVVPPLTKETDDLVYGFADSESIGNTPHAKNNADNYAWFATEAFWTSHCRAYFC
ncbi:uncharacterized protein N7459_003550 [Penicillium hispanicum]|uniref:uncharacterized protein n=1 Tax=Penicillium hispanicum TaxID=1080232 RepID=UPI00254054C0|nr:uncharacterized protein N7459_003550 [Penicillium hispanicum]KAJ5587785.1 hypothetical protein N7459_003550 [Penicillium hispanicum]